MDINGTNEPSASKPWPDEGSRTRAHAATSLRNSFSRSPRGPRGARGSSPDRVSSGDNSSFNVSRRQRVSLPGSFVRTSSGATNADNTRAGVASTSHSEVARRPLPSHGTTKARTLDSSFPLQEESEDDVAHESTATRDKQPGDGRPEVVADRRVEHPPDLGLKQRRGRSLPLRTEAYREDDENGATPVHPQSHFQLPRPGDPIFDPKVIEELFALQMQLYPPNNDVDTNDGAFSPSMSSTLGDGYNPWAALQASGASGSHQSDPQFSQGSQPVTLPRESIGPSIIEKPALRVQTHGLRNNTDPHPLPSQPREDFVDHTVPFLQTYYQSAGLNVPTRSSAPAPRLSPYPHYDQNTEEQLARIYALNSNDGAFSPSVMPTLGDGYNPWAYLQASLRDRRSNLKDPQSLPSLQPVSLPHGPVITNLGISTSLPDKGSDLKNEKCLASDLTSQVTRDGHDPVASGGFADIYRGMLQENGKFVKVAIKAVKTYSGTDGDLAKKQKRLRREVKVWLNLTHVNVLPLLGTSMGFGQFPAMVCPWVDNGALTTYLEDRHRVLSVVEILRLVNDVASGLQYLHYRSVVHGDLSGSNILVREDGRACIADFGLSLLMTELGRSTFATSFHARGTLRWTAPELLDLEIPEDGLEEASHVAPSMQCDVYSFGSVVLQILSGKVPYHYYKREAQVVHAVSRGMMPKRPIIAMVTDRRWMFIQRCWSPVDSTRSRPSGEELVEFTEKELSDAGEL